MFSERAGRERALDLDIHQAPSKCQLKLFILTILHLHGCEKGAETKKDERWVQRARRRERDANTFVSGSRHSFQLLPESNTSSQHLFTASCFLHSPRPAAHPLRVLGPDATTLFQVFAIFRRLQSSVFRGRCTEHLYYYSFSTWIFQSYYM